MTPGLKYTQLHGEPGVLSARYAGPDADDRANNEQLLAAMKHLPDGKRGARFVCCIAFALPDGTVRTFTGFSEGTIGRQECGRSGFGYDPLFYPQDHRQNFCRNAP